MKRRARGSSSDSEEDWQDRRIRREREAKEGRLRKYSEWRWSRFKLSFQALRESVLPRELVQLLMHNVLDLYFYREVYLSNTRPEGDRLYFVNGLDAIHESLRKREGKEKEFEVTRLRCTISQHRPSPLWHHTTYSIEKQSDLTKCLETSSVRDTFWLFYNLDRVAQYED